MIYEVFKSISSNLNEYLKGIYNTPEDMVVVTTLSQSQGDEISDSQNKVVISLLNIERETAMGISSGLSNMSSDFYKKTQPPWYLNMVFVVAAVYNGQQYLQSLKVLSNVYEFFQTNNRFSISSSDQSVKKNWSVVVDLMNVNFQELTNFWSVMGGSYYPSMVGKIRMIALDSAEIASIKPVSKDNQIDIQI
jgi:uncharacterized protein DUF4255